MDDVSQSGFGRGWVPLERDLGLPGDGAAGVSRCPSLEGRDGDGCLDAGVDARLRLAPPPQPLPGGEGLAVDDPVFTPALKVRFLDELSRHGNVRVAAARVGVSRSGLYLARRRDLAFDAGWQAALGCARRHAEAVLAERALDGVEEPVFFRGELIAVRRRFDSRLLLAHLARLDQLCAAQQAPGEPDHATSFDLALARVAGIAVGTGLPEARAAHVADAAEQAGARFEAVTAEPDPGDPYDYTPEPGDAPIYENEAIRAAEEMAAAYEAAEGRYHAARAARIAAAALAAGAAWDARQAGVWQAVDAVLAGEAVPAEFKSLDPVQCVQSPGSPRAKSLAGTREMADFRQVLAARAIVKYTLSLGPPNQN